MTSEDRWAAWEAEMDKRRAIAEATGATHWDTGGRCMVAHYDEHGRIKPACHKCACGVWVAHDEFRAHFGVDRIPEPDDE